MSRLSTILAVAGVLALVALVSGTVLGQPLLLSYVESGSMSPTLEAGDGFVAVPTALTGPPEVGDVVVFRAEVLQGGGLVTHRIVDRTDQGYVTRGDANPFTDQDGGEPPVPRERIAATALQVNGQVVVLPGVGTVLGGLRGALDWGQRRLAGALGTRSLVGPSGVGYLLVGLGVVLLALARVDPGRRERSRDRDRDRGTYSPLAVAVVLCALLVVPATGAMVLGANTHAIPVSDADDTVPGTVAADSDGRAQVTYRVPNDTPLPTLVVFEPTDPGVALAPSHAVIPAGDATRVTASVTGPGTGARTERTFAESRYLPVLPSPLLVALHEIHPWLAVLAVDAVVCGAVVLAVLALIGIAPIRVRSRRRSVR